MPLLVAEMTLFIYGKTVVVVKTPVVANPVVVVNPVVVTFPASPPVWPTVLSSKIDNFRDFSVFLPYFRVLTEIEVV